MSYGHRLGQALLENPVARSVRRLSYLPAAWRVTKVFDDAALEARKPVAVSSGELVMPARCPHCGGKAEWESGETSYDKTMQQQLYYAVVRCTNIVTCGAGMSVILNDEDAARTQCVEQWNRRHNVRSEMPIPAEKGTE